MLDAEADLKMKGALDRPPNTDRSVAIREIASRKQGWGWLRNLLAARRGPGQLSADEFFYYGLHRPDVTRHMARAYIGKSVQHRMHVACNNWHWFAPCHDKPLFYTILRGAGLPTPKTLSVVSPAARAGYKTAELTAEGIKWALRETGFPVFAKPVAGVYSLGTMVIEGIEGDEASVRSHGRVSCESLADYMRQISPAGYLLQAVLSPHPEISEFGGGAVPSLRLLIIASETPTLISAVLKLPAASNIADNFWRSGNMLAAIDRADGSIRRAVVNKCMRPSVEHAGFVGRLVPDWEAAVSLALDGSRLFPPIRTQSWDVALTDAGPVLLEFNFGGDLNLHQLSHDRGFLTDEFREHLRRCGYKGKL